MSEGVHYKVFFKQGDYAEVKRFFIEDPSAAANYEYFREKLLTVFSGARHLPIKITYTDFDGDDITVNTDEDLFIAYTVMTDGPKIFNVIVRDESSDTVPDEVFTSLPAVVCDGCNEPIVKNRYKCLECADFDLCANCEHRGLHSQHLMLRSTTLALPRSLGKMMHNFSRAAKKAHYHYSGRERHHPRGFHRQGEAHCSKDSKNFTPKSDKHCPFNVGANLYSMADTFLSNIIQNLVESPANQTPQPGNPQTGSEPASNASKTGSENGANAQQQASEIIGNLIKTFAGTLSNLDQATANNNGGPSGASAKVPTARSPTPETPMHVDEPEPVFVKSSSSSTENIATVKKPSEPGWTILTNTDVQGVTASAPSAEAVLQTKPTEEETKYVEQLSQLRKMGFSNDLNLIELLNRFDGNIGFVINHIFQNKN